MMDLVWKKYYKEGTDKKEFKRKYQKLKKEISKVIKGKRTILRISDISRERIRKVSEGRATLGCCWTWIQAESDGERWDLIERFDSLLDVSEYEENIVIFYAKFDPLITDKNAIDLEETFRNNFDWDFLENEISLKGGTKLLLEKIFVVEKNDKKWKKIKLPERKVLIEVSEKKEVISIREEIEKDLVNVSVSENSNKKVISTYVE